MHLQKIFCRSQFLLHRYVIMQKTKEDNMENKFAKYPKLLEQMANDLLVFFRCDVDSASKKESDRKKDVWKKHRLLEETSQYEKWEYVFENKVEIYIETDRITLGEPTYEYQDFDTGKWKTHENTQRIWYSDYGMGNIQYMDKPLLAEAFCPYLKTQVTYICSDVDPENIKSSVKGNTCQINYKKIKIINEPKPQQPKKSDLKSW